MDDSTVVEARALSTLASDRSLLRWACITWGAAGLGLGLAFAAGDWALRAVALVLAASAIGRDEGQRRAPPPEGTGAFRE
jgi:hypothetical protein